MAYPQTIEKTQAKIDSHPNHMGHVRIISGYNSTNKKCLFNDDRCNHGSWLSTPRNIQNGSGCPECFRIKQSTQRTQSIEITQSNIDAHPNHAGYVKITKGYKNTQTKCWFNDSRCDHPEWKTQPCHVQLGVGCPLCGVVKSTKKLTLSKEVTQKSIDSHPLHDGHVKITRGYVNTRTPCWFNDDRCDHPEWQAYISTLSQGYGCPLCGSKSLTAKTIIAKIQRAITYVEFKVEYSPSFLGNQRYDAFFILENGIYVAFEYDGEFHFQHHWSYNKKPDYEKHRILNKTIELDELKNSQSVKNGVHLIRLDHITYKKSPDVAVGNIIDDILELSEISSGAEYLEIGPNF